MTSDIIAMDRELRHLQQADTVPPTGTSSSSGAPGDSSSSSGSSPSSGIWSDSYGMEAKTCKPGKWPSSYRQLFYKEVMKRRKWPAVLHNQSAAIVPPSDGSPCHQRIVSISPSRSPFRILSHRFSLINVVVQPSPGSSAAVMTQ